jgi:hypothetical protein
MITAIGAPLEIHVRDHLKPRGFDVAGSGSTQAPALIARASSSDPASSVLALVRLGAPFDTTGAQAKLAADKNRLARDLAVATVLDWRTAHYQAMVVSGLT